MPTDENMARVAATAVSLQFLLDFLELCVLPLQPPGEAPLTTRQASTATPTVDPVLTAACALRRSLSASSCLRLNRGPEVLR